MFNFGPRSLERLATVDPLLQKVVRRALELSEIDFSVVEGVRTLERQRFLVKTGASQTLNSKHLPDAAGFSQAVDLAAYLDTDGDGKKELSWHTAHVYAVAQAMQRAAQELGVLIRWGGCWKVLNNISSDLATEVDVYCALRLGGGGKPFVDGPHFELYRA